MAVRFVHLHVHTEYSLVDGVVRIESEKADDGKLLREGLIDATARMGMPAVALTDQANLFALVKFYKTAQSKGIKPLIGVDALVRDENERNEPSRLVLLCQDGRGYLNLTRLVTRSYLEGQGKHGPTLHRAWLDRDTTHGLIALSGAREGDVGRALVGNREPEARAALESWLELFGDRYYLELQRTGRPGEEDCIAGSLLLAVRHGVPVVATNDVRFIRPEDFEAHEARVCIHEGLMIADASRPRRYSEEQYLRSPDEMATLFADLPEALDNSVEIARRLNLEIKLGKPSLPAYPVPAGQTTEEHLREESKLGLEQRWPVIVTQLGTHIPRDEYASRLASELDVICQMGFAGYFLIVADFIRWARANGVPVGPGRGSGAGSLVAYSLGITDLDPLHYDLLFERFLNPERVSMPDFDVDFCMEGRDRVIDYVAQRYGRERVSQIITYGTMAAKAVVRDVARVQGLSYGFADSIAKLIPFELGITLDDALDKEEELRKRYKNEDDVRQLIDMARSLEGLVRNAGTHAGGVVIAPSVLTDFAPLYCEEGSTQRRHAVRQGRRRGRGPRQVRLPRPAHAHDHRLGGAHHQRRARRGRRAAARHVHAADGRRADVRAAEALRDDGRVPARIARHEGPDQAPAAGHVRGHHRARRAVPPGPAAVGHGRRLHRPQARPHRRRHRLPAPGPEARPVPDLRRDPVPGTGHADRAGAGRLHARRRRPAAARDGQEESRGDGAAAFHLRRRRDRARRGRERGRLHLRPDGEVRGVRLQQVALGRVRRAVLSHGVAEDALPGGVHGGGAVVRHGQDRQGRHAHRRVQPHGAHGRAARRQRLAVHVHDVGAEVDPLRPRRHQGRRAGGRREHARGAQRARAVPRPARPLPPARPQQGQPSRARGPDPLGRDRLDGRHALPLDADAPVAGGDAGGRAVDTCQGSRPGRPVRPCRAGATVAGRAGEVASSAGEALAGRGRHARNAARMGRGRAPRRRARNAGPVPHRAIRSPSTSASCAPSPADASPTSAAPSRSAPGARRRAIPGAARGAA